MNQAGAAPSIHTQDEFEYKLLMRIRQLRGSRARLLVDLNAEELQVLGRVESLNRKTMNATAPVTEMAVL